MASLQDAIRKVLARSRKLVFVQLHNQGELTKLLKDLADVGQVKALSAQEHNDQAGR